ncbi:MAG: hypothetical protein M1821_005805 [Bathelium mastoideum]|nr:MAG: hypothetical protein M1821_005805 [Bathelium mastoideum]
MALLDSLKGLFGQTTTGILVGLICGISLFVFIVSHEIHNRDLWGVPGPILARYTNAWRAWQAWRYATRPHGITYHEVLHERYGDVVRVGPRTVFINDAEAIPKVLGFKQRLEKSDSIIPFSVPGIHTSLVGIRNEQKHAAYRRPIQGAYSLSSLRAYEPAVDEMIGKLDGVLDKHAADGKPVNISSWCHYFAYDTIMRVTFGHAIGFMENGRDMYNLIENQARHVAYVRIITQFPKLDYWLKKNPVYLAFKKHKESPFFIFAKSKIKEQLANPESEDAAQRTLLSHFLYAKERYPDIVDDTQVRLYCSTNTLAGSLSPSRVLDLICTWLVQNPWAQDRLYEEVRSTKCNFPVPLSATMYIPFLEGVIKESYRLHHGSDIAIERHVPEGGLDLPDGRHLPGHMDAAISSPSMRLNPIYGANPGEYNPERWMRAKGESEQAFLERRAAMDRVDLTFSQGSRACIGKSFTHLEIFKVVASLMGQFKFEAVEAPRRFAVPVKIIRRSGEFATQPQTGPIPTSKETLATEEPSPAAQKPQASLPSPPFIFVDGVPNFRDIGGYAIPNRPSHSVRRNFIFRSAHQGRITATGVSQLQSLGITTRYDLRSQPEIDEIRDKYKDVQPIADIPGIPRIFVPVYKDEDNSPEKQIEKYANLVKGDGTEAFVESYTRILEHGGSSFALVLRHIRDNPTKPFMVHCALGKDRTGVCIALILKLAGVADDVVAKEFALTETGLGEWKMQIVDKLVAMGRKGLEKRKEVERLLSAKAEDMQAVLLVLNNRFGGAEEYVEKYCEMTEEDVSKIKANLIVDEESIL